MDHESAALANVKYYDGEKVNTSGSPHLNHQILKNLFRELVDRVFINSGKSLPRVLDLGAGDGISTIAFLELGATVTAIDISKQQLEKLKLRCDKYDDRLKIICMDVLEALNTSEKYDIIVMNSFIHHIPDYVDLMERSMALLEDGGQLFSFQDPLRYDTVNRVTYHYGKASYLLWRLFQGDTMGGIKRRLRRNRGVYLEDSIDNAEYHVVRNGVDQIDMQQFCKDRGYHSEIIPYFSTQLGFFQTIGSALKMKNTFAFIAQK